MKDYSLFVKEQKESEGNRAFYLRGVSSFLFPNEAFQHDAGISYVNMAESVTGASIANIQHGFASVFYQKEQHKLKIASEDVFRALDLLKITEDYVIVSFDIYWDYYIHKGDNGLVNKGGNYSYHDAPIIRLHGGPSNLVSQKLFIMKKTDMPSLSYLSPNDENIRKYELTLLDDKYNLYGSIVKLSQNVELLKGVDKLSEDEALNYSLFNVFINAKMAWKQSSPLVSIKLMYDLKDNGTTDLLENVRPFDVIFANNIKEVAAQDKP